MDSYDEKYASPCIGVCFVIPETDICAGCFRTVEEISNWRGYNPDKCVEILKKTDERRASYGRK